MEGMMVQVNVSDLPWECFVYSTSFCGQKRKTTQMYRGKCGSYQNTPRFSKHIV